MRTSNPHISIEIARTLDELTQFSTDWDELARCAVEPNIFYESGAVLAAIRHLATTWRICCVFVYLDCVENRDIGRTLIGFFPFQRSIKGPKGTISCYQSLNYICCYLSTPLVHRDHLHDALSSLLGWMDTAPDGVRLFGLYKISGDGEIAAQLTALLRARRQPNVVESSFFRAFISVSERTGDYLSKALPRKKIKEYRRQRKRLSELGCLTINTVAKDENGTWAKLFLDLEAKGWKGRRGDALKISSATRGFFQDLVEHFSSRDRAILQHMRLGEISIAMKCSFISADGNGSFAFKIAFDEEFAKFSPGVLLELENIRYLQDRPGSLMWMDSCADPNHPMIDHLWRERRNITYVLCGCRSIVGRILVGVFRLRNRQLTMARRR